MSQPGHRRAYTEDAAPPQRWTPYRRGLVAIVAVLLGLRVWMLSSWSFLQDDLLVAKWVETKGFVDYILTDFAGHVLTGELLIGWVFTKLDPLDYTWPALTICAFSALVAVGWGLALREIFGERLHLLVGVVILCLTPGMTAISLWWISALNIFPMLASMGFALWFLSRYLLRDQSRRDLVLTNVSYALGLFMWEKSLLVTVPLFFLVLLLGPPTIRQAVPLAVRVLWPTALLTVAYLAFFAWSVHGSDPGGDGPYERTFGSAAELVAHGSADATLPALFGGPLLPVETSMSAFRHSPTWLAVVLWAVTLVLAVVGARYRRRGGVALAMMLTYAVISWGLVFFSGRFPVVGAGILGVPRYSADLLAVAVLGCLYMVTPVRGETEPLRRAVGPAAGRRIRRVLVVHLVATSVIALVASVRLWHEIEPSSTKPYMDNLVADARALGDADVYDTRVPQELVSGVFLPEASHVSAVLSPLRLPLRYDQPTDQFVMVASDGHFRNARVNGGVRSVTPGPDGDCGYGVDVGETVQIPLDGQPFEFQWGVEISYFTGSDALIAVQTDTDRVELDLPTNEAGSIGLRQLLIEGAVTSLTIEGLGGDSAVCVTEVKIGPLEPTDQVPASLLPGPAAP